MWDNSQLTCRAGSVPGHGVTDHPGPYFTCTVCEGAHGILVTKDNTIQYRLLGKIQELLFECNLIEMP